jgi:hypothetical protein
VCHQTLTTAIVAGRCSISDSLMRPMVHPQCQRIDPLVQGASRNCRSRTDPHEHRGGVRTLRRVVPISSASASRRRSCASDDRQNRSVFRGSVGDHPAEMLAAPEQLSSNTGSNPKHAGGQAQPVGGDRGRGRDRR